MSRSGPSVKSSPTFSYRSLSSSMEGLLIHLRHALKFPAPLTPPPISPPLNSANKAVIGALVEEFLAEKEQITGEDLGKLEKEVIVALKAKKRTITPAVQAGEESYQQAPNNQISRLPPPAQQQQQTDGRSDSAPVQPPLDGAEWSVIAAYQELQAEERAKEEHLRRGTTAKRTGVSGRAGRFTERSCSSDRCCRPWPGMLMMERRRECGGKGVQRLRLNKIRIHIEIDAFRISEFTFSAPDEARA